MPQQAQQQAQQRARTAAEKRDIFVREIKSGLGRMVPTRQAYIDGVLVRAHLRIGTGLAKGVPEVGEVFAVGKEDEITVTAESIIVE